MQSPARVSENTFSFDNAILLVIIIFIFEPSIAEQQRRFCSARGRKLEAGPGALMSQSMSLSDDGDVDSYFL